MTNDGDIVNKILRARNNHEKEYTVTVNKPITDRFIERMEMEFYFGYYSDQKL
jgi:23S rRNA pseudouridine2604 synthase